MQLKVTVPTIHDTGLAENNAIVVKSFRDVVAIGATVAREVRAWLRAVPMTPHPKTRMFGVTAEWVEDKAKPAEQYPTAENHRPKRRKKASK